MGLFGRKEWHYMDLVTLPNGAKGEVIGTSGSNGRQTSVSVSYTHKGRSGIVEVAPDRLKRAR